MRRKILSRGFAKSESSACRRKNKLGPPMFRRESIFHFRVYSFAVGKNTRENQLKPAKNTDNSPMCLLRRRLRDGLPPNIFLAVLLAGPIGGFRRSAQPLFITLYLKYRKTLKPCVIAPPFDIAACGLTRRSFFFHVSHSPPLLWHPSGAITKGRCGSEGGCG